MKYRLQREIEKLKKSILTLAALVEERLHVAIRSINQREKNIALEVINGDQEIDEMEVELEEECLKLLALHQPVAIDLRFIIAVLKINNDLERIGDLVVNICERSSYIVEKEEVPIPFDFNAMSEKVKTMLKISLDSLVNMDSSLAYKVREMDDEIDDINRHMFNLVEKGIIESPKHISIYFNYLSVSRHLERIGDLATNIAEDVIYMVEGKIVRHAPEKLNK